MPKYAELTELERGKVLGLRLAGDSMSEISKKLKISKGAVYNTIKRYENCDGVQSASRSGRPKTLNEDDQKTLEKIINQNNRNSLDQIRETFSVVVVTGKEVSTRTIRRNLHELGIHSRIAAVKLLLSQKQRMDRLQWSKSKRNWSVAKWKTVMNHVLPFLEMMVLLAYGEGMVIVMMLKTLFHQ